MVVVVVVVGARGLGGALSLTLASVPAINVKTATPTSSDGGTPPPPPPPPRLRPNFLRISMGAPRVAADALNVCPGRRPRR